MKAAAAADLPPGAVVEVRLAGRYLALCNVEGEVRALEGECPHHGGPLGHGALNGANVVCPWHLWEFDCRTGAYDRNPELRLRLYPAKVENGDILVEI